MLRLETGLTCCGGNLELMHALVCLVEKLLPHLLLSAPLIPK